MDPANVLRNTQYCRKKTTAKFRSHKLGWEYICKSCRSSENEKLSRMEAADPHADKVSSARVGRKQPGPAAPLSEGNKVLVPCFPRSSSWIWMLWLHCAQIPCWSVCSTEATVRTLEERHLISTAPKLAGTDLQKTDYNITTKWHIWSFRLPEEGRLASEFLFTLGTWEDKVAPNSHCIPILVLLAFSLWSGGGSVINGGHSVWQRKTNLVVYSI